MLGHGEIVRPDGAVSGMGDGPDRTLVRKTGDVPVVAGPRADATIDRNQPTNESRRQCSSRPRRPGSTARPTVAWWPASPRAWRTTSRSSRSTSGSPSPCSTVVQRLRHRGLPGAVGGRPAAAGRPGRPAAPPPPGVRARHRARPGRGRRRRPAAGPRHTHPRQQHPARPAAAGRRRPRRAVEPGRQGPARPLAPDLAVRDRSRPAARSRSSGSSAARSWSRPASARSCCCPARCPPPGTAWSPASRCWPGWPC